LGLGGLPLWALGLASRIWLVLGARVRLGSGLGVLALDQRVRLLGAARAARLRVRPRVAGLGCGSVRSLRPSHPALGRAARAGERHRPIGAAGSVVSDGTCARDAARRRLASGPRAPPLR